MGSKTTSTDPASLSAGAVHHPLLPPQWDHRPTPHIFRPRSARLPAVARLGARVIVRVAAGVVVAASAARAADEKTVLVIYAETRLVPVVAIIDQAIRSTLQSSSPGPIRFYTEYLDLSWFAGGEPE